VYFFRIARSSARDEPVYGFGTWFVDGILSGARAPVVPLLLAAFSRGGEVDAIVMRYTRTATSGCGAA
jgi:hypothetical protein